MCIDKNVLTPARLKLVNYTKHDGGTFLLIKKLNIFVGVFDNEKPNAKLICQLILVVTPLRRVLKDGSVDVN